MLSAPTATYIGTWVDSVGACLHQETNKSINTIVYLENNACFDISNSKDLFIEINGSSAARDIKWLGWRVMHRPNSWFTGHWKPVIEGSKLIAFKGALPSSHLRDAAQGEAVLPF